MANEAELVAVIRAKNEASGEFDNLAKKIKGVEKTFNDVSKKAAIAAGAIVASGIASVKMWADAGSEIYELSQKTGMSTEALSEWKYIAEQSGSSIGAVEVMARKLAMTITDAASGSKAQAEAFNAIGIEVSSLQALKPEEQFTKIALAVADIKDPMQKAALAQQIFGRSGLDLLPMLADGSKGIAELRKQAKDLGIVFSEDTAKKADATGDKLKELEKSFEGVKNAIAVALAPVLTEHAKKMQELVVQVADWVVKNPEMVATIFKIAAAVLVLIGVLKVMAVAMTIVNALSGIGWVSIAAAGAAAVAAYLLLNEALKVETPAMPTSPRRTPVYGPGGTITGYSEYARGGRIPGPAGQPVPIMAHGGEEWLGVGAGRGGGGDVYVSVNVGGSVTSERDLVDTIREEILKIKSRNVSTGF